MYPIELDIKDRTVKLKSSSQKFQGPYHNLSSFLCMYCRLIRLITDVYINNMKGCTNSGFYGVIVELSLKFSILCFVQYNLSKNHRFFLFFFSIALSVYHRLNGLKIALVYQMSLSFVWYTCFVQYLGYFLNCLI